MNKNKPYPYQQRIIDALSPGAVVRAQIPRQAGKTELPVFLVGNPLYPKVGIFAPRMVHCKLLKDRLSGGRREMHGPGFRIITLENENEAQGAVFDLAIVDNAHQVNSSTIQQSVYPTLAPGGVLLLLFDPEDRIVVTLDEVFRDKKARFEETRDSSELYFEQHFRKGS